MAILRQTFGQWPNAPGASKAQLAAARADALSDFHNAYSEDGVSMEDMFDILREEHADRLAGPDYTVDAMQDAAQEYACTYTDLVQAERVRDAIAKATREGLEEGAMDENEEAPTELNGAYIDHMSDREFEMLGTDGYREEVADAYRAAFLRAFHARR